MTGQLRVDEEVERIRRIQELRQATNEPGSVDDSARWRGTYVVICTQGTMQREGIAKLRQWERVKRVLRGEDGWTCAPILC
jgi:hypothetical protein